MNQLLTLVSELYHACSGAPLTILTVHCLIKVHVSVLDMMDVAILIHTLHVMGTTTSVTVIRFAFSMEIAVAI